MGESASEPASERTDGPAPFLVRFLPPAGAVVVLLDAREFELRETLMLLLDGPVPVVPVELPFVSRERRLLRRVGAPTDESRAGRLSVPGTPRTTRRPGLSSSSATAALCEVDAAACPRARLTPGAAGAIEDVGGGVKSVLELDAWALSNAACGTNDSGASCCCEG